MTLLDENPNNTINDVSVAADIIGSIFAENITRTIAIDAPKLVYDMIDLFDEDQSSFEYTWFKSSGNLPDAVYNFLRTRDCFLDTFPFPSLEVSFRYKQSDQGLSIFGEVNWQTPNVSFPNLPVRLHTGAEYRIAPQYMEPDLGCKYSPGFAKFDIEPEYSVTSKTLPVAWDSNLRCFRSMVPANKQRQQFVEHTNGSTKAMKTDETKFSAKIFMRFPENGQFEQTTRYKIELEIDQSIKAPLVTSHPVVPNHDVEPEIATSPSEKTVNLFLSPRSQDSPIIGSDCRMAVPHAHTNSWLPSYANTPLSKRGRLVDEHMSVSSGNDGGGSSIATSSVERGLERLVPYIGMVTQSRKYSLWSCDDNCTNEVARQLDVLLQSSNPGQAADLKEEIAMRDVEYDADSDDSQELLLSSRALSPRRRQDSHDHSFEQHRDENPHYKLGFQDRCHLERSQHWPTRTRLRFGPSSVTEKPKIEEPEVELSDQIIEDPHWNDIGNMLMEKLAQGTSREYFVKALCAVADEINSGKQPPSVNLLVAARSNAEAYNNRLIDTLENSGEEGSKSISIRPTLEGPKWRESVQDLEDVTIPDNVYSAVFKRPLSQSTDKLLDVSACQAPPFRTANGNRAANMASRAASRSMSSYGDRHNAEVKSQLELVVDHEEQLKLNRMSCFHPSPSVDEGMPYFDNIHRSIFKSGGKLKDVRAHHILSQKRKATKLRDVFYRTPSSFRSGRLAHDQLEHLDLELATKRQRLSERVDSGSDMQDRLHDDCNAHRHDPLVNLTNVTTEQLGEAIRSPSPLLATRDWSNKPSTGKRDDHFKISAGATYATKSRTYESNTNISDVMPALRKKGSVQRMVFASRSKMSLMTVPLSPPTTEETASLRLSSQEVCPAESVLPNNVSVEDSKAAMEWSYLSREGAEEAWNRSYERHNKQLDESKKQIAAVCLPNQNRIQQTYRQLLDEKNGEDDPFLTHIAAAINASPVSKDIRKETKHVEEEEKKAFERIFLDKNSVSGASGSEMDWSTQEEGLSEELSGLDLKEAKPHQGESW